MNSTQKLLFFLILLVGVYHAFFHVWFYFSPSLPAVGDEPSRLRHRLRAGSRHRDLRLRRRHRPPRDRRRHHGGGGGQRRGSGRGHSRIHHSSGPHTVSLLSQKKYLLCCFFKKKIQDEPTATDDPPSFDESLYETSVAEDALPINNCFSVTATSTVTPITYDTIEVSPAGYDAVFEIGQTTGVFDCNVITAGLEDTDRHGFQGGMN